MTDQAKPLLGDSSPRIRIGGKDHPELSRDLIRLEVSEHTGGLKTLMMRLGGLGPRGSGTQRDRQLYLDGGTIDFGKPVEVLIGADPERSPIFRGFLSAFEACYREGHPSEVIVFAEDRLMKLRMTRRSRTYTELTDAQIAEEIAREHGLSCEAAADGPQYDLVQQWNMSDLAFLRARGQLVQAEVFIQDQTLHFQSRNNRSAPSITLARGRDLLEVQLRADLAHQRTEVRVSGYDAFASDSIDESAGPEVIQNEIAGGKTGPQVLKLAFGERVSYRVREVPLTSEEAVFFAQAEMRRRCRSFVTVVGLTNGTPQMVVGSRLRLQQVGAPFEGDLYYVTQVCQAFDLKNGHRTRFTAERATINEAA